MKYYFDIRTESGVVDYADDGFLFADDIAALSAAASEARAIGAEPKPSVSGKRAEAIVVMDEMGRFLAEISVHTARLLM